jgi:LysW-gamma-L-lysine carboxypeptidase
VERWRALVTELNQGALGCDAPNFHLLALESAGDGLRDTVRLRPGFRLPPRLSGQVVIDGQRQLNPKAHLEIEGSEPRVTVPRSGPLPTAFSRAIRAAGRRPGWQQRLATSDPNVVLPMWKCAAVVYGPGDAELDHTPLESIALDDYGRAIEVLTRVLTEL